MRQWSPEQTIEPNLALTLVQEQFPEIKAERIFLLGNGWDNTAFLINNAFVFRFPRRDVALALLEAEWAVLPKLAAHLPVPIPVPKWKGGPARNYPWPFLGYRMLSGFTACSLNLTHEERASLAVPIALFLKALHATPKSLISDLNITPYSLTRADSFQIVPKMRTSLQELEVLGIIQNQALFDSILHATYRKPVTEVIVHGDFYVRHLLVNESRELVGVIDWGDVHLGDPAMDLAIAHSFLPEVAHESFRKNYGPISDETWQLARLRALHSAALLTLYGHHAEDPTIFQEGLLALQSLGRNDDPTD